MMPFFELPRDLNSHPGFWTITKWFIILFCVLTIFHFFYLNYIMKENEKAQKADHEEHKILLSRIDRLERIIRIQRRLPIRKIREERKWK